jgi:hypothetical protein
MPKKRYIVDPTDTERTELLRLSKKGQVSAHTLLQADERAIDDEITSSLHVGLATVARIRKPFVEGSLEWALTERHRPGGQRKLVGKQEAFLSALPDLNGLSPERCRGYGQ